MARPRQVSDEKILEAARRCFLEKGPSASTSEIAERVGLSQPALFKRFGTKERLLAAALAPPAVPAWVAQVDAGPDARSLRPQLQEIAQAISAFFRELIPRLSVLRGTGVSPEQLLEAHDVPPPVVGHRALTGWFERARDAGRLAPDTDCAALAMGLLGAVHLPHFLGECLGERTPMPASAEVITRIVDAWCQGIEESAPMPRAAAGGVR